MTTLTKVTINTDALAAVHGVKRGETVQVKCKHGVPVTREWRNRFRDSKIDGCITINQNKPKTTKKRAD